MRQPFWQLEGYDDMRAAIRGKCYDTKLSYPSRKNYESVETVTLKSGNTTTVKDFDLEGFNKARSEYQADQRRLLGQFQEDCFQEVGISVMHSKADALWSLAWDHGHSAGYSEVLDRMDEFAELLR